DELDEPRRRLRLEAAEANARELLAVEVDVDPAEVLHERLGELVLLAEGVATGLELLGERLQLLFRVAHIGRERLGVRDLLLPALVRLLRAAGDVADRSQDETEDHAGDDALTACALPRFLHRELVDLDALRLRRRRRSCTCGRGL